MPLIVASLPISFLGVFSCPCIGRPRQLPVQTGSGSGGPASSVRLKATNDLTLTVPLAQSIERPIHANVRLVLLSPEDIVRANSAKMCNY